MPFLRSAEIERSCNSQRKKNSIRVNIRIGRVFEMNMGLIISLGMIYLFLYNTGTINI